jgi:hypothetical protein
METLPPRFLYASSEIEYFSTKEMSSSQPPEVTDEGSRSITCNRYLLKKKKKSINKSNNYIDNKSRLLSESKNGYALRTADHEMHLLLTYYGIAKNKCRPILCWDLLT